MSTAPPLLTLHVTLTGNAVDYVAPLAANLRWAASHRPRWAWVVHVDASVPALTRAALRALHPALELREHPDSEEERAWSTLWRYAPVLEEAPSPGPVAVLDADEDLTALAAALDAFLSSPADLLLRRPSYAFTAFTNRVQANVACFRDPARCAAACPGVLSLARDRHALYAQVNAPTLEAQARGPLYGLDEFVLSALCLPRWEEEAGLKVEWFDAPLPRPTVTRSRSRLRALGLLRGVVSSHALEEGPRDRARARANARLMAGPRRRTDPELERRLRLAFQANAVHARSSQYVSP